jgi:threonine aldolase
MRKFIAEAPVGDDCIDTDPTVERLQELTAELLGKEAAIYMPSGTMTNQTAVRLHCGRGDELLCEANCHILNYEQGGFAQLSGAVARPVTGEYGVMRLEQLQGMIRPDNEHFVRTRLVCIENTHNRGAGRIQPYDEVVRICAWAHEHGLRTHLDGARLFNAAVASGIPADQWAQHFDTVSVCFSKGLGAPVGSALAGSRDLIREARRHRKLFGGGMRQAGIIAAGALYALENHIDRLADDHAHAQILAEAVREIKGLKLEPDTVDTNIVIFRVDPQLASAPELVAAWKERGVLTLAIGGTQVRAVTHLDVNETAVRRAAELLRETADALRRGLKPVEQGEAY